MRENFAGLEQDRSRKNPKLKQDHGGWLQIQIMSSRIVLGLQLVVICQDCHEEKKSPAVVVCRDHHEEKIRRTERLGTVLGLLELGSLNLAAKEDDGDGVARSAQNARQIRRGLNVSGLSA